MRGPDIGRNTTDRPTRTDHPVVPGTDRARPTRTPLPRSARIRCR